MSPTIVFATALLLSWVVIVSNVNAVIHKKKGSNILSFMAIVVIALWSYLFYLLH